MSNDVNWRCRILGHKIIGPPTHTINRPCARLGCFYTRPKLKWPRLNHQKPIKPPLKKPSVLFEATLNSELLVDFDKRIEPLPDLALKRKPNSIIIHWVCKILTAIAVNPAEKNKNVNNLLIDFKIVVRNEMSCEIDSLIDDYIKDTQKIADDSNDPQDKVYSKRVIDIAQFLKLKIKNHLTKRENESEIPSKPKFPQNQSYFEGEVLPNLYCKLNQSLSELAHSNYSLDEKIERFDILKRRCSMYIEELKMKQKEEE